MSLKNSIRGMVVVGIALAIGTGCDSGGKVGGAQPRDVLKSYVEQAFNLKSRGDLEKLGVFLTGDAKRELENLRDQRADADAIKKEKEESFKARFIDQKYKPGSVKLRDERRIDEDSYSITYELTYRVSAPEAKIDAGPTTVLPTDQDRYKNAPTYQEGQTVTKPATEDTVTTKKNAIFRYVEGKWLISEVQNLKTVIEHTTEESISGTLKK